MHAINHTIVSLVYYLLASTLYSKSDTIGHVFLRADFSAETSEKLLVEPHSR